jgi:hypothetical protein
MEFIQEKHDKTCEAEEQATLKNEQHLEKIALQQDTIQDLRLSLKEVEMEKQNQERVTAEQANTLTINAKRSEAVVIDFNQKVAELSTKMAEWKKACEQALSERDESRDLLEQSETDRLELRDKYISVGKQMEAVLKDETLSHQNAVAAYQQKIKGLGKELNQAEQLHKEFVPQFRESEVLTKRLEQELVASKLKHAEAAMALQQRVEGLEMELEQSEKRAKVATEDHTARSG